jgi:hypothetical protein
MRYWFLLTVLLLCLLAVPAQAENLGPGGGARIIIGDQPIGPYRVLMMASPEPAPSGPVTFVVRISDSVTGEKVRNAQVTVTLTHSQTGAILTETATHDNAGNPLDYAAHIELAQDGVWNGVLRVAGPAGPAETAFTQRIVAPRGVGTVIIVGVPFLVVLVGLAGFWYFRSGSRAARP